MVRFLLKLFLTVSCLIFFKTTVWSVEQTVVYFAFQYGIQDTGSPVPVVGQTDSYLSTLETKHGSLKGKITHYFINTPNCSFEEDQTAYCQEKF